MARVAVGLFLATGGRSGAQESGTSVILDTAGIWRIHQTLAPPRLMADDGTVTPLLLDVKWLDRPTAPPPADWMRPESPDRTWLRGPARRAARTPYLERLCLRGKFEVTDPAAVGEMTLAVEYHGGVVVYLNGREFGRGHLRPTAADAETYPMEAFLDAEGGLLVGVAPDELAALRRRTLRLPIPKALLQRGVNVLAVEIRRAPYPAVLKEKKPRGVGGMSPDPGLLWNTGEIRSVTLTADSDRGVVPNAARPAGLQVWNGDVLAGDVDVDFGDRTEPMAPVEIVSPRNGSFYGKILVGSDRPIQGLRVAAGNLTFGEAVIPSSRISFRYGVPGGAEELYAKAEPQERGYAPYRNGAQFLNTILPAPLPEYPLSRRGGAVAPVWIRVRPPRDAVPGLYRGVVEVHTAEGPVASVPLQVTVLPWTIPDPQDFRTWVELMQSPDTLSVEYETPLWSDRHFELIAQSFRLIRDTGARSLYIPAIAHTNLGNAESMIRWIRRPDGSFGWDFSVMERYLDTARAELGTPKLVVLVVWEVYMNTPDSTGRRFGEILARNQRTNDGAPLVTFINAAGETENGVIPKLGDPASREIWRALLGEVRARLKARGLEGALALGLFTDSTPNKEDTRLFFELAPDLGWVQQGHNAFRDLNGIAPVSYTATWWSQRFADDLFHSRSGAVGGRTPRERAEEMTSLFGWNRPKLDAYFPRMTNETHPVSYWHFLCETAITGDFYRGIGRVGADYWPVLRNRGGRRVGWVNERFEEVFGYLHSLRSHVLEPQADGPAAMTRLLVMEEGVQACEARIFIEDALLNRNLAQHAPELAARCRATLDERLFYLWRGLGPMRFGGWGVAAWRFAPGVAGHAWLLGTDPRNRTEQLFRLAGEVDAQLRR